MVAGCVALFSVLPGVYYAAIGQILYHLFIPYTVVERSTISYSIIMPASYLKAHSMTYLQTEKKQWVLSFSNQYS